MKQQSFYVTSDILKSILNIHTDQSDSYIKSNFIDKSIKDINKNTDIKISIDKKGYEYKNDMRIVKYKVIIEEYKGTDMKIDLRQRKKNTKTESQIMVDDMIEEFKRIGRNGKDIPSMKLPMLQILNTSISHLPLYIDDEYRITNGLDVYTENSDETQTTLQQWDEDETYTITVRSLNGFPKGLGKMCFLTKQQLCSGGFISNPPSASQNHL